MKEEQKWSQNWFYFSRPSQSNYISKVLSFVHWNSSDTQNIPRQFVSCFLLMGQKDHFLLLKFFPLKSQILPRSQEIVGLGTQQPQAHWPVDLSIHQLRVLLWPSYLLNTYFLDLLCTRSWKVSWVRPGRYTGSSGIVGCVLSHFSRVWLCVTPPGSSVHGIFQARLLEWVAVASSRGLSRPRDWTWEASILSQWGRGIYKNSCLIYNGISLSHKRNKIGSFVEMWMDLENVIQREVNQKWSEVKVAQSHPTLCDPMDHIVHGIL